MTDRERLRELADKATPAPWHYDGYADEDDGHYGHVVLGGGVPGSIEEHMVCWVGEETNRLAPEDAAFIAACDPDTIRALLDELRRAEARPCMHGDPTCPCQDGDPCHYEPFKETPAERCPDFYRAERAETERDAAWAEVERLRAAVAEVVAMWDACGLARDGEGPAIRRLRAALSLDGQS